MKFDSEWLLSLLDESGDPDTVAEALTNCGFLVEVREPGDGAEIWDVEVTTNRPDAMNHRGLAREAAVATGSRLRPLKIELRENETEKTSALASIEIDDPTACSRFAARVVRGVRQEPSPDWLQRRLANCGVRPINAVVDVTNYVLLELGQPLHAYDLAKVRGGRLVARRASAGEELVTLDGEIRRLHPEMGVIADDRGVVGLAGIMGGADTEIGADTVDVLLEAAHFDALMIRRGARRLGMHTEASHRFERGANPDMPPTAVDLAAAMMADLAGGRVCAGRIDVHPQPATARRMEFSLDALSAFAGLDIAGERVHQILTGLGLEPQLDDGKVRVAVPPRRVDIELVPDLYEEVIRHVGFAAIPSRLPSLPGAPGRRDANWRLVDRARDAAIRAGLNEIVTWGFIDPDDDALVDQQPLCPGPPVPIVNPLAQTQGVMRRSLLPGMVAAAQLNLNQGEGSLELFEQGRVFSNGADRPQEDERLGVLLSRTDAGVEADFRRLKGIVIDVLRHAGMPAISWRQGGAPWLDDRAGAEMVANGDRVIGFAGELSGSLDDRWALRSRVMVAEIDLGLATTPPTVRFKALPRFPAVVVDMTIEHPLAMSFAELERAARELASDDVEDIGLAHDEQFMPDPKGDTIRTTLRLVYRHPERSLTQDEVNAAQNELRAALAERHGVAFA
jgi:phenylalanyl-tRNA synthetase beta chain